MTEVRIIRSWTWPDLATMSPGNRGVWEGVHFTEREIPNPDYIIISNNLSLPLETTCPSNRIWRIIMEPPAGIFEAWHEHQPYAGRTFTCDPRKAGDHYVRSHPMLPWHVNRTYDELVNPPIPSKKHPLSWITGTREVMPGQKLRMAFLRFIRGKLPELCLLGGGTYHMTRERPRALNAYRQEALGFRPITDKWEGLAPYLYSLAIENTSCRDYWTEKIADCFLAYTVPFYFGCPNLEDYFPEESFIRINVEDHEQALARIQQELRHPSWSKRLSALKKARELVLHHYHLYPSISRIIQKGG